MRGGRGGRGGPGRGGAAVRTRGGQPRGGAVNGRSPRVASPNPVPTDGTTATETKDVPDSVDAPTTPAATEQISHQNGVTPPVSWTDSSSSHLETPATSVSSSWGAASTTSTWGGDTDVNGSSPSVNVPSNKVTSKPATSMRSWAQVARYVFDLNGA